MADLVIPVGYGQATVIWTSRGRSNPLTVTHGYDASASGDAAAHAQAIYDAWTVAGGLCDADNMTDSFTFEGITVHDNKTGTIEGGAYLLPVDGTKGSVGGDMIVSSTWIIKKQSTRIGRKFRGRMYVPFNSYLENKVDMNGIIDSVSLAAEQAAAALTFGEMVDLLVPMYILHHDSTAPTEVSGLSVANKVGTQRRRIR